MKDQLSRYVNKNWRKFGLKKRPTNIDFYIKNRYRKLNFYLFEQNKRFPFALAKLTPFPRDKNEILREHNILKYINANVSEKLRQTIPRPISLANIGGIPVHFRNILPGEPMTSNINTLNKLKSLRYNFYLVNQWSIAFNKCLIKKPVYLNRAHKIINAAVNKTLKLDDSLTKSDFKWANKKIQSLKKSQIYLTPQHTDLWAKNILLYNKSIKVLDWEDFGMSVLPLFDIYHFIVSYFLGINFYFKNTYQKIFFKNNIYKKHIIKMIRDYCKAFNIDYKLLDILFLSYLLEFYVMRHQQEGPNYSVTKRSNKFLKIFLENRENFILNDLT